MTSDQWPTVMVAHLARCKRTGMPYEAAWRDAMSLHPPSGNGNAATLFNEAGEPHDTYISFLKRVARKAYEDYVAEEGSGDGPALRTFRIDLLRDTDFSRAAQPRSRRAA